VIVVDHRETPNGTYHYVEIGVGVTRGAFVVSASQYVDGSRTLALTLRGPRNGYWNSVVMDGDQAHDAATMLRAGAPAWLTVHWGFLVVEPIVLPDEPRWDGRCQVGYESKRGRRMVHVVDRVDRYDLAAAIRFVTEEAWFS
jgi:hypothetical protein